MGIPQGSILSPILFNIMIYDLPKVISSHFSVVQYADDIALWTNVSMKRKTSLYEIKHIQKLYQLELNRLSNYLMLSGFDLSTEKTKMILFSKCLSPRLLPKFYIKNQEIQYCNEIKFLGVYFTNKLSWKKHINHLLQKATKSYFLLMIISKKKWGQNISTLLHLATALVRSKLSFGQEVYFSAPKTYLNKLQSLDSKSVKLALGVPIHAKTINTYKISGILSLDDNRKLACSKYIIRSHATDSFNSKETSIRSDKEFSQKSRNMPSLETIATYTSNIFQEAVLNPSTVSKVLPSQTIPLWESNRATFDIPSFDSKQGNPLLVASQCRSHLEENYLNELRVFTDGSVLDNGHAGSGFVVPALQINKSYYIGHGYSIFTAELIAILMALQSLLTIPLSFLGILLCVDSKSALSALNSTISTHRSEIVLEIKHTINCLILKGIPVTFCWIPSHCGFIYNDAADRAAKLGAKNINSDIINIPLSKHEMCSIVENLIKKRNHHTSFIKDSNTSNVNNYYVHCLANRLKLNAWKTKYCKNINCLCDNALTVQHLLYECHAFDNILSDKCKRPFSMNSLDIDMWLKLAKFLLQSPIGHLL